MLAITMDELILSMLQATGADSLKQRFLAKNEAITMNSADVVEAWLIEGPLFGDDHLGIE